MKRFLLILLFSLPHFLISQQKIIDSLKIVIDTTQSDLEKVRYMNELASAYWYTAADSTIWVADEIIRLIENKGNLTKNDWIKEKANALNNKGVGYYIKGNFPKSLNYFEECKNIAMETGDSSRLASAYNNLGLIHNRIKNYDEALDSYTFSSNYFLAKGNITQYSIARQNIANTYYKKEEYQKALAIYEEVYFNLDSLEIKQKASEALYNVGLTLYNLERFQEADSVLSISLNESIQIGNPFLEAMHYVTMGGIRLQQEKLNESEQLLRKAEKLLTQSQVNYKLVEVYEKLSEVLEQKRAFKEALFYHKKFLMMKDSMYEEEKIDELTTARLQFAFGREKLKDSLQNVQIQREKQIEIEAQDKVIQKAHQIQIILIVGFILIAIFAFFLFRAFRTQKSQKEIIQDQKEIVEEKNIEIMDSIAYAKRIQSAILPPNKLFQRRLPNAFVLYKPKDIVAGDFYWMEEKEGKIFLAVADCTGHGVPGAMVSVICNNGLNRALREHNITHTGAILDKAREIVIQEFEKSEEEVKDGMDIALVSLEQEQAGEGAVAQNSCSKLKYSGAHNPLWIIRKGSVDIDSFLIQFSEENRSLVKVSAMNEDYTLIEIKADKQPVGKFKMAKNFTEHKIQLQKGDTIYLFSDGYADQFGGEVSTGKKGGKKFKSANFKRLLTSIQDLSMEEQRKKLDQTIEDWRGDIEQIDDICVIGVRV